MENQSQIILSMWEGILAGSGILLAAITGIGIPFLKSQASLASWKKGIEKDISAIKQRIDQDEKSVEKDIASLKERLEKTEEGQKGHNTKFYELTERLKNDHSEMKEELARITTLLNLINEAVRKK